MKKRTTFFALANLFVYGQSLADGDSSVELIEETSILNCVFNDFENKETQEIDLGFEGLAESGQGLEITTKGSSIYCGKFVMPDVE